MANDKDKLLKEISEFLSKQGHFKPYDIEKSNNLISKIKDIISTCRNPQLVSELDSEIDSKVVNSTTTDDLKI